MYNNRSWGYYKNRDVMNLFFIYDIMKILIKKLYILNKNHILHTYRKKIGDYL